MIILRKFVNEFTCNRREVGVKCICDSDRITATDHVFNTRLFSVNAGFNLRWNL